MNNAIKRAIDKKGSAAALASAVKRSPQFIGQLLSGKRPVPAELCPVIEQETGVLCEELRPDVAWTVLRHSRALRAAAAAAISTPEARAEG